MLKDYNDIIPDDDDGDDDDDDEDDNRLNVHS